MGGPPSGPYPNYGDTPAEPSSAGYQQNNNMMYYPPSIMQQNNSQWTQEYQFQQPQWNYRDQEQGNVGYFANVPPAGQPAQRQGQQQAPQNARSITPPLSENMTITPSPFKAAVQSHDTTEEREKIMEDALSQVTGGIDKQEGNELDFCLLTLPGNTIPCTEDDRQTCTQQSPE